MSNLETWYVVHDGLPEDGSEPDTNPLAAPADGEDFIREEFKKTISNGFANRDLGLYITKLTDVTAEQADALEDDLETVVASGFKGYNTEVVEQYKTTLDDWAPEALGDLDHLVEGQEPDADGWYRS